MKIRSLLILLVILTVVSAATLRLAGQPAGEGEQAKTTLLDHIKPGQPVGVKAEGGRYEIAVWPGTVRPLSHEVVAVGSDYVCVRDIAQVSDTTIPVYSISALKVMRIGGS